MSSIKGFEQISRKLKNLEKKAGNRIVRRGAAKMAQVVRKEMRRNAPRKSGKLNKELRYKVSRDRRGGFTAKVGAFNDAFYAKFLEDGTKAHKISGKKGGRLRINGNVRPQANHPGTRGTKFLSKSFQASRKRAIEEAGKIMMKELAKL